MSAEAISKLDQYALIAQLSMQAGGTRRPLGKKAFQKLVHLTQELGGVNLGYRFAFYTYGPYSSELAGDLDIAAALGAVKISYNQRENYYRIEGANDSERIATRGRPFLNQIQAALDRVLMVFGDRSAKELELVSTITYLRRYSQQSEFADDRKLIERVRELKPKYSDREIAAAIGEVRSFLQQP